MKEEFIVQVLRNDFDIMEKNILKKDVHDDIRRV
jgi:hypothetical protein